MNKNVAAFFAFARERYTIYLKKEAGKPKPWTKDPILQQYRFTNVFREDDKVTKWFRESGARTTTFSCVAMRLINRIDNAELMLKADLFRKWNPDTMRKVFKGVKPVVSAAYVVRSPNGFDKLNGIIHMLDAVWADQQKGLLDFKGKTLQQAHRVIMRYPCVGSFIAYEVVTDLNHTPVLADAKDRFTWAAAGPGAARGLARILDKPLDTWNHHSQTHQVVMLKYLQGLLKCSHQVEYWPSDWPRWSMREPEHLLCEFDKYERGRLGEGQPKQKYDGV